MAATQSGTESRTPRQSRLVKAALGSQRFGRVDVRIRNVSESGIGGVCDPALVLGEQVTVYLPGHRPMKGMVRWSHNQSFGIETDQPIEIDRLRTAHGNKVPAADSSVEFRIIPPTKGDFRRPPLNMGRDKGHSPRTCKDWEF